MGDPFAFLRSLVPTSTASADSERSASGAGADSVEPDLFAGSEPVPATPENTPAATAVDTSGLSLDSMAAAGATIPITAASPSSVPGDVLTAMQAALIDLDTRLRVVETYLHQNGVL